MKVIVILFILFLNCQSILISQNSKRTNVWYFGRNAGINFNTTPPTPLLDGALNIWEGCATICDTFGNIMIYTDGDRIWNKKHLVIPGAYSLGGNNSSTQSGIIVPKPGSDSLLYVFSLDAEGGLGGLRYSIVNINLNGKLGGLITSNNILNNQCSEKLTVIPHCNKKDFWIIAHKLGSNDFLIWELTSVGISVSPKIISLGSIHSINSLSSIGYMKSSADGSKLALGVYEGNFFELFDFNNKTGDITNPIKLMDAQFTHSYGVEFSPNGKRLYVAGTQNSPVIFQYNIDLTSAQDIKNSLTIVGQGTYSYFGAIQNAPNSKIYVAKDNSPYLSVINNPNELGLSCNFVEDGFYLNGKESALGLPNLIPSFFLEEDSVYINIVENCNGNIELKANSNIKSDSVSYQWYFEGNLIPNQSSKLINVNLSGEYEVKLTIFFSCETLLKEYSKKIDLQIPAALEILDVNVNNTICGKNNGSISLIPTGGVQPYSYSFDNGGTFQISNLKEDLQEGQYSCIIKDSNGCTSSEIVELNSLNSPKIIDIQVTNTKCGIDNGALNILANNGTGKLVFSIDGLNYQKQNNFNNLSSGVYNIIIKDSVGCKDEKTIEIKNSITPEVEILQSKSTSCNNNNGLIEVSGISGILPFEFSLNGQNYNSSGIFNGLKQGFYLVFFKDSLGCIDSINIEIKGEVPVKIKDVIVNSTSCGQKNGSIQINIFDGSGIQYSINGINFQNKNVFENISPGIYLITVKDSNSCVDTLNTMVDSSGVPTFENIDILPSSCGETNGSIIVLGSGGSGNLEYSINGVDYQKSNDFNSLSEGNYQLSIKDDKNCLSKKEISLGGTPPIIIENIKSFPTECGKSTGSLLIDVSGGTGLIEIALNNGAIQPNLNIENLEAGAYQLLVSDIIGCNTSALITVDHGNCPFFIPNSFSPNGDGINDLFQVYPHPDFKGKFYSLKIYNRWGGQIYERLNFDPYKDWWDGTFKGLKLNTAVFVYILEVQFEDGGISIIKGDINLIK
ncbi:MAG TPA: gliding motility-associated C-terminal domain-containing protein [Saprospiraceae bacterium]|nr:gliding motility-associated C-terminal domain-containing protein [Saprospiraceae bacterium]